MKYILINIFITRNALIEEAKCINYLYIKSFRVFDFVKIVLIQCISDLGSYVL